MAREQIVRTAQRGLEEAVESAIKQADAPLSPDQVHRLVGSYSEEAIRVAMSDMVVENRLTVNSDRKYSVVNSK